MRPKRPTPPPEPTPPIPGVVTPENLDAINTPEINKLPAYVSPGKFQWKSPFPGPKGDTGEPGEQGDPGVPGEPGVIARPITPPVATDEIADASVTADKLATDSVTQTKIARNTVGWSEIREQSLEPEQIKTLSGLPPTPGQVPVYDESQGNLWWFRWASIPEMALARPLVPPVATEEIADGAVTYPKIADEQVNFEKLATDAVTTIKIQNGAVTPAKLSFTPVARPLTPPIATDEIADASVTQAKLDPALSLGDVLTMFPTPQTALDFPGITATTAPAAVDLSAIIPVNTKGVIVSIACINQSYTGGGMMAYIFRQPGAEYALQVMAPPANAPGISNGASVLMPVADDRTLLWQAYVAGINSTELVIYILGYIV